MNCFYYKIITNNLIKNIIIFSFISFLLISCRNLFSDFIIETELCYDQDKALFLHTYKNGSSKTYYISDINKQELNKLDSSLYQKYYTFLKDTLIINLNLWELLNTSLSPVIDTEENRQAENTFLGRPVKTLKPFSNNIEVFRISEFKGLSFEELEKNLKYIKITNYINMEKQYYSDSVIKIFKLVKCCD